MKINLKNTLFLTLTPLAAIVGTAYWLNAGLFNWTTIVFSFIFLVLSGLGITVGYHRLFAHKAYRATFPVRFVLMLLGTSLFEGSIIDWCTDHRDHHRYTDTDKDPYNINRGFWYAHIGWLFTLDKSKRNYANINDLMQDKLVAWQSRFFVPLAIFMGFIFPMLVCSLWGDPLGGLFLAGALRITLNQHFTFCINSVCHMLGKAPFDKQGSAKDHWLTAILTYGEGYHNFHHRFPTDYRNGIRIYDYDPSKWVIRLLATLGLASDLKRVSRRQIIQARLESGENKLKAQIACPTQLANMVSPMLEQTRLSVLAALSKLENLEKSLKTLKDARIANARRRIKIYRQHVKLTQRELKHSLRKWTKIIDDSLMSIKMTNTSLMHVK